MSLLSSELTLIFSILYNVCHTDCIEGISLLQFEKQHERVMLKMKIPLLKPFNFESAVKSHGWWMLSPNDWDDQTQVFSRPLRLSTGKNVMVSISYFDDHLSIHTKSTIVLDKKDKNKIIEDVSWMFRLQEDFEPFYSMSQNYGELLHLSTERKGRLLRSPTLFEDVVKVILTTNTKWQQTINMTNNLVNGLGEVALTSNQKEFKTFPTPESILNAGEDYLKEHIRVGYRSSYIIDAAAKTLDDSFNLESFKSPNKDINDLKEIKGVGPYALNTLSMLLGKYDALPVDSEYRKHVVHKYFEGKNPTKRELESVYDQWEKYKYLAYWFDL